MKKFFAFFILLLFIINPISAYSGESVPTRSDNNQGQRISASVTEQNFFTKFLQSESILVVPSGVQGTITASHSCDKTSFVTEYWQNGVLLLKNNYDIPIVKQDQSYSINYPLPEETKSFKGSVEILSYLYCDGLTRISDIASIKTSFPAGSTCESTIEICANNKDDDCDTKTDELFCVPATTQSIIPACEGALNTACINGNAYLMDTCDHVIDAETLKVCEQGVPNSNDPEAQPCKPFLQCDGSCKIGTKGTYTFATCEDVITKPIVNATTNTTGTIDVVDDPLTKPDDDCPLIPFSQIQSMGYISLFRNYCSDNNKCEAKGGTIKDGGVLQSEGAKISSVPVIVAAASLGCLAGVVTTVFTFGASLPIAGAVCATAATIIGSGVYASNEIFSLCVEKPAIGDPKPADLPAESNLRSSITKYLEAHISEDLYYKLINAGLCPEQIKEYEKLYNRLLRDDGRLSETDINELKGFLSNLPKFENCPNDHADPNSVPTIIQLTIRDAEKYKEDVSNIAKLVYVLFVSLIIAGAVFLFIKKKKRGKKK